MSIQRSTREIPAAEAALRLHVSRERIVRLIQVGQLRGRKVEGVGWLVDRKALAEFAQTTALKGRHTRHRVGRQGGR